MKNELEILWGDRTFVFVSDKLPSEIFEHAFNYLNEKHPLEETGEQQSIFPQEYISEEKEEEDWQISDNPQSRRIFDNDLRVGIDFCIRKYGKTRAQIEKEAARQTALRTIVHG